MTVSRDHMWQSHTRETRLRPDLDRTNARVALQIRHAAHPHSKKLVDVGEIEVGLQHFRQYHLRMQTYLVNSGNIHYIATI